MAVADHNQDIEPGQVAGLAVGVVIFVIVLLLIVILPRSASYDFPYFLFTGRTVAINW